MKNILVSLAILLTACGARAQFTGGPGQGYAMSNTVLNEVLPVVWLEFAGSPRDEGVLLQWATAAEVNNDRFEVQHSAAGMDFTLIGTVQGSGNTKSTSRYTFVDPDPVVGSNYYRLRQVDFDGQSEMSDLISVIWASNPELVLQLYPNPASSLLNVLLPYPGAATLTVYNASGQAVMSRSTDNSRQTAVDVSRLNKGHYALVCKMGALSLSGRFVIE